MATTQVLVMGSLHAVVLVDCFRDFVQLVIKGIVRLFLAQRNNVVLRLCEIWQYPFSPAAYSSGALALEMLGRSVLTVWSLPVSVKAPKARISSLNNFIS
jgi:hypothetical protein